MVLLCLLYTGYCLMMFATTYSALCSPLPYIACSCFYTFYLLFVLLSTLEFLLPSPLPSFLCSPCITSPFPLPSPLPLIPSLPAHLDLSGSSTGDDLSLLPFCKEPTPPSEGEGLSLDHMSVSEGSGRESEGEGRKGNSEMTE